MKTLLSALVLHTHNFRVLHWNCCGLDFDATHELMSSYGDKLSEFTDEVAESLISTGGSPVNLFTAMTILKDSEHNFTVTDDAKTYCTEEALNTTNNILKELIALYDECNDCDLHPAIVSKLQEHQYWLIKESDYKGRRRLQK